MDSSYVLKMSPEIQTEAVHEPFLTEEREGKDYSQSTHSEAKYEESKIALRRRPSMKEFLLHIVGIAVIALIVYFNISNFYWEDLSESSGTGNILDFNQNARLKALQLAAKLHEIVMLASLSCVVLYYTHRLLIGARGIPFGLIEFPYTGETMSMLFDGRFWMNSFRRDYRAFGMLLFVACLLSIFLGPSSAIVMIPSLDWWPVKDPYNGKNMTSYFFKASSNNTDIFPSIIDSSLISNVSACEEIHSDNPDILCPFQIFADIQEWLQGYVYDGAAANLSFSDVLTDTQRSVLTSFLREPTRSDGNNVTSTYTTSLTAEMLMAIGTFWNYVQRKEIGSINDIPRPRLSVASDIDVYQPIVHVKCYTKLWDGTPTNLSFPQMSNGWSSSDNENDPWQLSEDSELWEILPGESQVNKGETGFSWLKDDSLNSSTSVLALSIVPVFAVFPNGTECQGSFLVPCSIDARWAAADISYQPLDSSAVLSNITSPLVLGETESLTAEATRSKYGISNNPIGIDLNWAQFLNVNWTNQTGVTMSAMNWILMNGVDSNYTGTGFSSFQTPNITSDNINGAVEETIANLLGIILTDSIARTGYLNQAPWLEISSNSTSDLDTLVPLPIWLKAPEYFFNSTSRDSSDVDNFVLRYHVDRYGYGYGVRSKTAIAAIACLLLYSVIVVGQMLFIICAFACGRYHRSVSWNTIGNFLALAMNSAPSDKLYGTSAGVGRQSTWYSVLKVREVGASHLELVVGNYRDDRVSGQRVKIGKKYD